ncbi:MAG: Asp-tRNA(Asn)/Glu-tRNA(Gln) amidotransferase subunit GatB [Candidatus Pacebacteria bacterium]|nr:Asp-tRNA(Asn)/Glu-tRNA(Gln) amidotransferase subunit GatB [Candidatus Paceibacterota bacterium]
MSNYKPKIGLEIHAELKTRTKMFCNSANNPDEKHPNINVCPVCMGYPGTLPVINKEAVKSVLKAGLALGGRLADYSRFDRKNYFYPDLPKGYQISQYKHPLVEGGALSGVRITRIHLEEDTGRLVHEKDSTLVDFNRAGVPLMELVTEPDIVSAEQARNFAEELRLVLRYLGISDADMEKGHMRIEGNISVSKESDTEWGTKVEIKNINSFKAIEAALKYEIERQKKVIEKGEKIRQETRGWDDAKQKTFSQRSKEEAHDYRYFPEPDLPPLKISEVPEFQNLQAEIPEMPWQKRERFKKEYGIKDDVINILANDKKAADFFESVVSEIKSDTDTKFAAELASSYIISDMFGIMKEKMLDFEEVLVKPDNLADLLVMIMKNKISSRVAKDVLREMIETGADSLAVVSEKGLEQTSDEGEIEMLVKKAIEANPKAAEDFKKGKENAGQFILGAVMKESKGKTNPQKTREILERLLKK